MENWEQALTTHGCRITAARRAIIATLQKTMVPLTPPEILTRGQTQHHALGLVTVYRTLAVLEELTLVRRVHRDDGCHGYLPAAPGHHHALVCKVCGRASEFSGNGDLDVLIARVQALTGYRVDDHLLQLVGVCPACQ